MPTVTQDTADENATRHRAPDPAARIRRLVTSTPSGVTASGPARAGVAGPDAAHPATALLTAALARFDAPVDLRVRGGLGSGRRTLAAALRARRGWRVTVEDLDDLAAPGAPPAAAPDVEIICLRTAPCRHEEAWARRPRLHPMLIVATEGSDDDDDNAGGGGRAGGGSGAGAGAGAGGDADREVGSSGGAEREVGSGGAPDREAGSGGDVDREVGSGRGGGRGGDRPGIIRPSWARGLPAVDARDPEHRSVDTVVRFVERALDALASVRVARLEAELERLAVHPEVGELAEAALCALDH